MLWSTAGRQTLLAMEGNWILKWRNGDGRFWEQFDGVEISLEWGCDGESEPWAVDAAGRCSILELDDREVSKREPQIVNVTCSQLQFTRLYSNR